MVRRWPVEHRSQLPRQIRRHFGGRKNRGLVGRGRGTDQAPVLLSTPQRSESRGQRAALARRGQRRLGWRVHADDARDRRRDARHPQDWRNLPAALLRLRRASRRRTSGGCGGKGFVHGGRIVSARQGRPAETDGGRSRGSSSDAEAPDRAQAGRNRRALEQCPRPLVARMDGVSLCRRGDGAHSSGRHADDPRHFGDDGPVRAHDLSSLRKFASTGEPWNPDPWLWLFHVAGGGRLPIINYSGGTEISGGILMSNILTPLKPCAFAGPLPGMAVDVLDERGNPVRGQVGELVIRQPWIGSTRGFWKDPQRYLETYWSRFPDVWVHGDWAAIDADGLWYILGRSDDTIKIAGKRLGPAEVESVLVSHPAVSEAAAIGVPDEIKGETVVCFCVLKPGQTVSETELRERVVRELGKPFAPRAVKF